MEHRFVLTFYEMSRFEGVSKAFPEIFWLMMPLKMGHVECAE